MLHYPARIELGHLPTPLEEMPRLTEALGGPRLFIKRTFSCCSLIDSLRHLVFLAVLC